MPPLTRFRRWRHSLSLTLGVAGALACAASALCEPGHWPYDFWMNIGTGALLGAVFAIAYRALYEEGSQPDRKPEN
jgi:hypothetical protein